jgi:hypothetical protein
MIAHRLKNKTLAAWLALLGGQLGLHRFYLWGYQDLWAWLYVVPSALGWWGVARLQMYGTDDTLVWWLLPCLGLTLAGTALCAIYYGLTAATAWNARYNPDTPHSPAGDTHWATIGAVVAALLIGTIALMSSLAMSFQHYFEYQVQEAKKISQ